MNLASGPRLTNDRSDSWLQIILPSLVHLLFTILQSMAGTSVIKRVTFTFCKQIIDFKMFVNVHTE